MSLEACERETHITISDSEDEYTVYSCQKKVISKLEKLGIQAYKVETIEGEVVGKYFKVPYKCISFKKEYKKRELTEEERKAIGERLRAGRSDSTV